MKRISADLVGAAIGERNVPDEKDFDNAGWQVHCLSVGQGVVHWMYCGQIR